MITIATFLGGIYLNLWNGGILIDNCGPVIIRLNIFALFFCMLLQFKANNNPSDERRGDFFSDYFWGTDLYPRIFGIDVKVWTNCRMGMTMWPLVILSCWFY